MADSPQSNAKSKKDMYWFAHGGEPLPDKNHQQRNDGGGDEEVGSPEHHNSPSWKPLQERKALPEEARSLWVGKECAATVPADNAENSSLLSHMERDDRVAVAPDSYGYDARLCGNNIRATKSAEDAKSKKIFEADQDTGDAKAKKKVDREAALEARRNAQRSNVSFAFGSSLPRNLDLDVTTVYQGSDLDRPKRRSTQATVSSQKTGPVANAVSKIKTDDKMSQSMISPMSACRGRRKTDLTPTIPYERTAPPRMPVTSASSGKRSVSMTRLDQLARPRRSYVEAQRDHTKANGTGSTSSGQKDVQSSPSRPRSSASEHSAGSNRPSTTPPVNMRARTTARKPRPVSIAGTMPDRKPTVEFKRDLGGHRTPEKKNEIPITKRAAPVNKAKSPAPKSISVDKPGQRTPIKHLTPKSSPVKKMPAKAKKSAAAALSTSGETINSSTEETLKLQVSASPPESPVADEENGSSMPESGGKRIISEEEARAALAEKRRLAREQAEKEAELERQRLEELRREEEERIRKEEEEQRMMEEEQLRLVEEHRRQEEEKLRKAIEEQEKKEQEEKLKREEEARLKSEQEKKAKEEAERQRIELEEKLRKEEEERAERKKRLEKIMSRTRGKGTSSTSSHSGGDQSDSADSQAGEAAEALSGNSSLNSIQSTDPSSGSASLENHPESVQGSENESLNSLEMMALSENSSLDSNLLMLPSEGAPSLDSDQASTLSIQTLPDEKVAVDVKNHSLDPASSKEVSVEPSLLFGAAGDKPSSCSSENETVNTDATIVPTEESKVDQHLPLASEIEDPVDSTSDKLLDFGTDSVQTLVSQTADNDFPVSELGVASRDIFQQPDVNLECFALEKKEDSKDSKPERNPFLVSSQEVLEDHDFGINPFIVPPEIPAASVAHNNYNEVQSTDEVTMDSENHKGVSPLEKEENSVSVELSTSATMIPSENVFLNEAYHSEDDNMKTSVIAISKLSSSPELDGKNVCIPVEDDVNSTNKLDEKSEQYIKSTDTPGSVALSSNKIFDGNSEHYFGSPDASQPSDLPNKIFDRSSEQYVENADASQSASHGKLFDGSSEQYVESIDASQSLGLHGKLFDGSSEQYVESVDASQLLGSHSKLFDGEFAGSSEQYVESVDTSEFLGLHGKLCDGSSEQHVENVNATQSLGSHGKLFDGGSDQHVESVDTSQSLGSHGKLFDGSSEQYVENADVTQSSGSSGKIFDGDLECFLENNSMPQLSSFTHDIHDKNSEVCQSNLVTNMFAESKSVLSYSDVVLPEDGASDMVKIDYSSGVITSVEDLEPSAIHSVHNRVNLGEECLVSASITDSEDSSLDSNLSQVMNVNILHHATPQEIGVLNSSPLDITNELSAKTSKLDLDASYKPFRKMPQYSDSDHAPTTNGYQSPLRENFSYGNGIEDDCKTSGKTDDQQPASSPIDNEVNSNVIFSINTHHVGNILNAEDINFNKVPSNPFLATDDAAAAISENQFHHQEEIIRNNSMHRITECGRHPLVAGPLQHSPI